MGTRGFVGVVVGGVEILSYNQFDSYPSGVGLQTLRWLREQIERDPAALRQAAKRLRVVPEDGVPTPEEVQRYLPSLLAADGNYPGTYSNPASYGRAEHNYYTLLRDQQGDLGLMLQRGVMVGADPEWPLNGLFCEWGYLVDLDGDGVFEVYEGFREEDHNLGRFGSRASRAGFTPAFDGDNYYAPVALVAQFPLAALPTDADFLAATGEQVAGVN